MADPQNFVTVVHEKAPDKPYRVPAHYLKHPTLKRGLRRATDKTRRTDQGGETKKAVQATTEGK